MGQYLAIGLAYKVTASIDDLNKKKISNEELRQEIENTLSFDLKLYSETKTDKNLSFTIKNQVLETDLIPFLEVFYPKVYNKKDDEECYDLLKQLRSTSSVKWIDLAREKSNVAFRYDIYAAPRCIIFSKDFHPSICLNFDYLMLYLGDGKILTEGINDFLDFFKYCIQEAFKEHSIAKSIHLYITG